MVNLRRVHIFKECFTMENTEESLEDSSELRDLKTLSTPCFSCLEDVEFVLRKTPNLLELICRFKGIIKGQLSAFDFPTQLETLHIFPTLTKAQRGYPICISASNLKKLTVGQFRLGIENLSNIAQLQNLQVLELLSINFDDKRWEVSNDEFSQLKVLTLSNCYFEEWIVADDAFPNLQRLYLFKCQLLEEIPSCFGDNCSLQSIQVHYCNESVEKSARDIQETQVEDYQNSGFELSITEWEYFSGEFRKSWRKRWLLEAGK